MRFQRYGQYRKEEHLRLDTKEEITRGPTPRLQRHVTREEEMTLAALPIPILPILALHLRLPPQCVSAVQQELKDAAHGEESRLEHRPATLASNHGEAEISLNPCARSSQKMRMCVANT